MTFLIQLLTILTLFPLTCILWLLLLAVFIKVKSL